MNAKTVVDIITVAEMHPGDTLANIGIDLRSQAGSTGDNSLVKARFTDDVTIRMENATHSTDDSVDGKTMDGLCLTSSGNYSHPEKGGYVEAIIDGALNVEMTTNLKNRISKGIYIQDTGGGKEDGSSLTLNGVTKVTIDNTGGDAKAYGLFMHMGGKRQQELKVNNTMDIHTTSTGGQKDWAIAGYFTMDKSVQEGAGRKVQFTKAANFQAVSDFVGYGLYALSRAGTTQQISLLGGAKGAAQAARQAIGAEVAALGGKLDLQVEKGLQTEGESSVVAKAFSAESTAGGILNAAIKGDSSFVGKGTAAAAVAYGVNLYADSGDITLAVEDQATIQALAPHDTAEAYGIYAAALNGGTNTAHFHGAVAIQTETSDQNTAKGIAALTDDTGTATVTMDDALTIRVNDGQAMAAYASGNNAVIDGSSLAKKVDIRGSSVATQNGRIQWQLPTADSYMEGTLLAMKDGFVDTDLQNGAVFRGNTTIGEAGSEGIVNVHAENGASWQVTESSTLTNLQVDHGLVDMTADGYQDLRMANLSGTDGVFRLDIDASTNHDANDRIYVTNKFTGTQYLDLNEVGLGDLDSAAGTVLATVNINEGTFLAKDGIGTLYYKRYLLDQQPTTMTAEGYTTDWYLKKVVPVDPTEDPTPTTDTVIRFADMRAGWLDHDQLIKRLGDLRRGGTTEEGVWARVKQTKRSSDSRFAWNDKRTRYQVGYDKRTKETEDYIRWQGFALSYQDGKANLPGLGKVEHDEIALHYYQTEMHNKGHYHDFVVGVHKLNYDLAARYDNEYVTGKLDEVAVSASAEYGRKKALGDNGWYIEPQSQLTLGFLPSGRLKLDNGTRVNFGDSTNVVGRLGIQLGKDFQDDDGKVYMRLNLLHEFKGKNKMHLEVTDNVECLDVERRLKRTWLELAIGTAWQIDENNHFYFDLEKGLGCDERKEWSWNIGFRRSI